MIDQPVTDGRLVDDPMFRIKDLEVAVEFNSGACPIRDRQEVSR